MEILYLIGLFAFLYGLNRLMKWDDKRLIERTMNRIRRDRGLYE